jgi:hypothetical protein
MKIRAALDDALHLVGHREDFLARLRPDHLGCFSRMCSSVFATSWSSFSPLTVWPQGQLISFAMLFFFRLVSRTSATQTLSIRRAN